MLKAPPIHSHTLPDRNGELGRLLQKSLTFQSVSGQEAPFVEFIADWASHQGFVTDLWYPAESDLHPYVAPPLPRHIPFKGRPTLVVRHAGLGTGPSLLFNAHSDVVAAPKPERWRANPWAGQQLDGTFIGRGACDVKGPLVAALGAMLNIKDRFPAGLPGDLLLELVPGEEDSVGLGTLTSIARGYRADAAIILEPTENFPRCASRAGLRFDITAHGRAVHGTVKWLGQDAIQLMRAILDSLATLESRWNDRHADPHFNPYPIARPMTVDTVRGGEWQGMVCDHCVCGGYLELLPADDIDQAKHRFQQELSEELAQHGFDPAAIEVIFSEEYRGHATLTDSSLCRAAEMAVGPTNFPGWSAFNSGCEAGVRASVHGTPTLVWGPGTLASAHAVDESIDFRDIMKAVDLFTNLATHWSDNPTKDNS